MQYGILQTNILGTSPPRCSGGSTRQHFHRLPFEGELATLLCHIALENRATCGATGAHGRTDLSTAVRTRPTEGHRPRVPGGTSAGSSALLLH